MNKILFRNVKIPTDYKWFFCMVFSIDIDVLWTIFLEDFTFTLRRQVLNINRKGNVVGGIFTPLGVKYQ